MPELPKVTGGFLKNEMNTNYNNYIGISVNKITFSSNCFNLYLNIYNLHFSTISVSIKNILFISDSKEQIIGKDESATNSFFNPGDKILDGYNILKKMQFKNPKRDFNEEDSIIVDFNISADTTTSSFMLSENLFLIKNREIKME